MRWIAWTGLVVCCLALGCGDSGSGATASAGPASGGAPAPPGGESPPDSPPEGSGGNPGDNPESGQPAPEQPPPDSGPPVAAESPPGAEGGALAAAPGGGEEQPGAQPGEGQPADGQPGENPDGTPRRPLRPLTLREEAFEAYREGRDVLGLRKLNAHYAVLPEAKQDLAKKMAWFPALSRPALVPRIGIAVQYSEASSPKDFRGSPMPFGSAELTTAVDQMQQNELSDNRIGGSRRASKFGSGSGRQSLDAREGAKGDTMRSQSGPQQLTFYTGELGEKILDAIEERFETGEYGAAIQDIMREASQVRSARRGNPNQPGEQPQFGGDFGGQPGEGQRGGSGARSALDGIYDQGDKRRWASRSAAQEQQLIEQIKPISPSVVWLGKEEGREQILKLAEMAGVDVLIIFDMTVHEARTGELVNSTYRVRLLTTKGNKPVPGFTPEPLVNIKVEQWRQKEEKGLDPVDKEVTKLIEALDGVLRPTPLPEALTAERAKKRIDDLIAEKPADPLPTIVEARYYAAKGLLTEQDYITTAVTLLGKNGFAQLQAKAKVGDE